MHAVNGAKKSLMICGSTLYMGWVGKWLTQYEAVMPTVLKSCFSSCTSKFICLISLKYQYVQ